MSDLSTKESLILNTMLKISCFVSMLHAIRLLLLRAPFIFQSMRNEELFENVLLLLLFTFISKTTRVVCLHHHTPSRQKNLLKKTIHYSNPESNRAYKLFAGEKATVEKYKSWVPHSTSVLYKYKI